MCITCSGANVVLSGALDPAFVQVAGDQIAGRKFDQPRRLLLAACHDVGAARMKGAAGRRIHRAGHIALQYELLPLYLRVRDRHRR